MQPRIKVGLIVGAVGLVLNSCIGALMGICGPGISLIAGAAAGFLAAQREKATTKGNGARLGAVSGALAGALVLVGQVIGATGSLAFFQFSGTRLPIGQVPPPSAGPAAQLTYYAAGIGTGLCFGVIGILLAALAGAGTGYVGTPDQPITPGQSTTQ